MQALMFNLDSSQIGSLARAPAKEAGMWSRSNVEVKAIKIAIQVVNSLKIENEIGGRALFDTIALRDAGNFEERTFWKVMKR